MASPSELDSMSRPGSPSPSDSSSRKSHKQHHDKILPWVLHHIIENPLCTELPLRIMFTFNAGHKLPSVKEAHKWWTYDRRGKYIIKFLASLKEITPPEDRELASYLRRRQDGPPEILKTDNHPQDRFSDGGNGALLAAIDYSDTVSESEPQPHSQGMPLNVVESVCHLVWTPDYQESQSNMALTAIDYLQDLEYTRRACLQEAARSLKITKDNWRDVLADHKLALEWIESVQKQELVIEKFYAMVYLDTRIWTMIKELHSGAFYKPDILALLNTLFPPGQKVYPNDVISPSHMARYRAVLFKYVLSVEKEGAKAINVYVNQLLVPGAKHSWTTTRANLDRYFDLAGMMIEQAKAVRGIGFFEGREDKFLANPLQDMTPAEEAKQEREVERVTATLERGYTSPLLGEGVGRAWGGPSAGQWPSTSDRLSAGDCPSTSDRTSSEQEVGNRPLSNSDWTAQKRARSSTSAAASSRQSSADYTSLYSQPSPKSPITPASPFDMTFKSGRPKTATSSTPDFQPLQHSIKEELESQWIVPTPPRRYSSSSNGMSMAEMDEPRLKKVKSMGRIASRLKSFASISSLKDAVKGPGLKKSGSMATIRTIDPRPITPDEFSDHITDQNFAVMKMLRNRNFEKASDPRQALTAHLEKIEHVMHNMHDTHAERMKKMSEPKSFFLEDPPSPSKPKKLRKSQSSRSIRSLMSISEEKIEKDAVKQPGMTRKRSWQILRRSPSSQTITGDDIKEPMPAIPLKYADDFRANRSFTAPPVEYLREREAKANRSATTPHLTPSRSFASLKREPLREREMPNPDPSRYTGYLHDHYTKRPAIPPPAEYLREREIRKALAEKARVAEGRMNE